MKRIVTSLVLCFIGTISLMAQIGINTEFPRQIFHVDGKGNNLATGNISQANAEDDVFMTKLGGLAIGTPEIADTVNVKVGAVSFQLQDGSEGVNKALASTANGSASWYSVSGVWYATLSQSKTWTTAVQTRIEIQLGDFGHSFCSSTTDGAVNATNGTVTIPYDGIYKVVLNGWFSCIYPFTNNATTTKMFLVEGAMFANRATSPQPIWTPHQTSTQNQYGINPTWTTVLNLNAGDVLSFVIYHGSNGVAVGSATWASVMNQITISAELITRS